MSNCGCDLENFSTFPEGKFRISFRYFYVTFVTFQDFETVASVSTNSMSSLLVNAKDESILSSDASFCSDHDSTSQSASCPWRDRLPSTSLPANQRRTMAAEFAGEDPNQTAFRYPLSAQSGPNVDRPGNSTYAPPVIILAIRHNYRAWTANSVGGWKSQIDRSRLGLDGNKSSQEPGHWSVLAVGLRWFSPGNLINNGSVICYGEDRPAVGNDRKKVNICGLMNCRR